MPKAFLLLLIFLDSFLIIEEGFFKLEIWEISYSLLSKNSAVLFCSLEVSFNQKSKVEE